MRWATRHGIHIDRAASAWLITTYVDPEAEFVYVDEIGQVNDDTTAFDMRGCTLTLSAMTSPSKPFSATTNSTTPYSGS